jgi:hypothetical protein
MFDSASRYGRNVFGVSCRYVKDGQIADRTLGRLTQEGRQSGEILAAQFDEDVSLEKLENVLMISTQLAQIKERT